MNIEGIQSGGTYVAKGGDLVTVAMDSRDYNYAKVGAYGYSTTYEDECTSLGCTASITFYAPISVSNSNLNIAGTGSDLFLAHLGTGTTSTIACTEYWTATKNYYYLNASTLSGISGSTAIYTYGTNTPAPQATYSDGTRWKDWNGSKFVYGGDC